MRSIAGLVFAGVMASVFAATAAGCDPLQLPAQPDGGPGTGTVDGGDGSPTPVPNGLAPAGAILGGSADHFGGRVQTWALVDSAGKLTEFSFTLPITTVTGIPVDAKFDVILILDLPAPVREQSIFKIIDYTYLPFGHIPAGVYDTPHWEWHFGVYSADGRPDCKDPTLPPKEFVPDNWVVFECVLNQGMHAYDLAAPEYNQQRFEKGHYNSYYQGKFISLEPQVTRTLLLERKDLPFNDSPRPKKWGTKGLYPTKFSGRFDAPSNTYVFTYKEWIDVE